MNRTLAGSDVELLNTSGYDNLINSFQDKVDVGSALSALIYGLGGSLINVIYLLLFGGIFYLMWHDHKSLLLPSIAMLLFGKVIFTFIPESIVLYAQLFAMLGLATVLVKLYRDGRQ